MKDYLFRGSLKRIDRKVFDLCQFEAERQFRKIILIPSETTAPLAVREALSSVFQNIYAEGYPDDASRIFREDEIFDYEARLADFRRNSDPRYYKGVEYADIIEMLARRRCAEIFVTENHKVDEIFVNVQPLSGAPANNAVYHALINPGDTIMGMNLLHGGHLSHGSPVNRSGKYYHAVHYTVDPDTEKINYDAVQEIAITHKPRIIVAGFSSYPWSVDWARFREIADLVGAYLLADIAHVAGLVAGKVYPSPVDYADVITFTTHKSICGPRGACILSLNEDVAKKIDRAVFPGEQGGPHVNIFAAMAVAFKLARTQQFQNLQQQIVKNCVAFTQEFINYGLRIPFGGTNTHLMNLDCGSIKGKDGTGLSGDQAARILDIAGIVVNRNTIPGDVSAADPSGIRMGTPWISQRGFVEGDMKNLARIIIDLLHSIEPYGENSRKGIIRKSKIKFFTLEKTKLEVRELAQNAGVDIPYKHHDYPHFYYLDDVDDRLDHWVPIDLKGNKIRQFLDYTLSCEIGLLEIGKTANTLLHTPGGTVEGFITCLEDHEYQLTVPSKQVSLSLAWLRSLSDGYVHIEADNKIADVQIKLPGAVIVKSDFSGAIPVRPADTSPQQDFLGITKPFYIGIQQGQGNSLPDFINKKYKFVAKETPLIPVHEQLGAKIIQYSGWKLPESYTSMTQEHITVRQSAGLFDLTHMGIFQVEGPDAASFLDSVCGNDIGGLDVGTSCYTHLLNPDAKVIDDLMVYHRRNEKFLLVVNAFNNIKDWEWLNAVKEGSIKIDQERPWAKAFGRNCILLDLKNKEAGDEMRVNIALQGPKSLDILLSLLTNDHLRKGILGLKRSHLCEVSVDGFDMIISRTGYTGEKIGFELFVHPDKVVELYRKFLQVGEAWDLKPIGLRARESLRLEAGLPLYGQELGEGSGRWGCSDLGVQEAGFSDHVKLHKPWFIGRKAFIDKQTSKTSEIVRFSCINEKKIVIQQGDLVLDKMGQFIGWVTSWVVDIDEMLIGQANVENEYATIGSDIYIYPVAASERDLNIKDIQIADRYQFTHQAKVVKRFM